MTATTPAPDATATPAATPSATAEARSLPRNIFRSSGKFFGRFERQGRTCCTRACATLDEALTALAELRAATAATTTAPAPATAADAPLPPGISRVRRKFKGQFRHGAHTIYCGSFDRVEEAVAALTQEREARGLPPLQIRRPRMGDIDAAPDDHSAAPDADERPADSAWWRATRKRIDALVERVEAEEGLGRFTLPPDPRRRPANPR